MFYISKRVLKFTGVYITQKVHVLHNGCDCRIAWGTESACCAYPNECVAQKAQVLHNKRMREKFGGNWAVTGTGVLISPNLY